MKNILTSLVLATGSAFGQAELASQAESLNTESYEEKAGERAKTDSRSTSLTIHSENFAVVKDHIFLDVPAGGGEFFYDGATADLEPTSVILLSNAGEAIAVREQRYRNDTLSSSYLLSLFEGKAIEFMSESADGTRTVFGGRVVSSGYEGGQSVREPVFQINGKMRFGLPGTPLFPSLGDDTLLKPRLEWKIASKNGYQGEATVSYLSGGMGWEASYNLVIPGDGKGSSLTGLVSIRNHTGREFSKADIKLLAGEVSRAVKKNPLPSYGEASGRGMGGGMEERVVHKSFDEYHVYLLAGTVRLRDRETKQVGFLDSRSVQVETVYNLLIPSGDGVDSEGGAEGKVQVVRRFSNNKENGLGGPLPGGTIRVYRLDEGSPEFLGEERIGHAAAKEEIEIATGFAFDITARKIRTGRRDEGEDYMGKRLVVEGYRIEITNRKNEAVVIGVAEEMRADANWSIVQSSHPHRKTAAGEAKWEVELPADSEIELSYEVETLYP